MKFIKLLSFIVMASFFIAACGNGTNKGDNRSGLNLNILPNFMVDDTSSYTLFQKSALYINRQGIRQANPGTFVHAVSYADFDQDGDTDVFMSSGTSQDPTPVELYLNDGAGNFILDTTFCSGNPPGMIHPRKALTGDFNGDGKIDIFVVGHGHDAPPWPGEAPLLILSSPSGYINTPLPDSPNNLVGFHHGGASADIDSDGDIDVFVASGGAAPRTPPFFLINDGSGHFEVSTDRLSSDLVNFTLGPMFSAELIDIDKDGYVDLIVAGNEYVLYAGHVNNALPTLILWGDSTGYYSTRKSTTLPALRGNGAVLDIDAGDIDYDGDKDIICVFRCNSTTDSGVSRPLIPV
ncbi:MAG: VCBS repeat-containing protein [bacterium]